MELKRTNNICISFLWRNSHFTNKVSIKCINCVSFAQIGDKSLFAAICDEWWFILPKLYYWWKQMRNLNERLNFHSSNSMKIMNNMKVHESDETGYSDIFTLLYIKLTWIINRAVFVGFLAFFYSPKSVIWRDSFPI